MTEKILIVDDSATARALFRACLHNKPEYEVIQAGRWEEALEKAQSYKPFLVVVDYNMPDKTGSEIAQLMQEQGVTAHFVLISANTQISVIREVEALGFFDVIEKPVSAERIHSLLERLS